jgi:peroxiredoxin
LAEYRDQDFSAIGARVAAVSVDDPTRAEPMRAQLELTFPVLCDTQRQVITDWGLLNQGEKGGIAYPAIFVLDKARVVRYRSLDRTASRVGTTAVREFLTGGMSGSAETPKRRAIWPGFSALLQAVKNGVSRGTIVPKK